MKLTDFRVDDGREGETVRYINTKLGFANWNERLMVILCYFFQFGLTLDKTKSDAMNPFIDNHQDKCILEEPASMQHNGPIAYLNMDLKKNLLVSISHSI